MKFIKCLCLTITLFAFSAKASEILDNNKIYHFYQPTCPHCHEAINYINEQYPDIKMVLTDITQGRENYNLFVQCVKKFKLGHEIGTPLFCMGGHYIMGWSPDQQKQFDEYIKDFLK